jgi:hypothetical protein
MVNLQELAVEHEKRIAALEAKVFTQPEETPVAVEKEPDVETKAD